jgi:DNA-entry nuclease
MYRVRPYFRGDDLVAAGVLMEARSVEDPRVQFCVFCYNVQPGVVIDYATGKNRAAEESEEP